MLESNSWNRIVCSLVSSIFCFPIRCFHRFCSFLSSFFLSVFLPTTNNRLNTFDEFSESRSSWLARRNPNEESCTWLLGKCVYSRFSFLFASDVSAIMLDMSRFTSYDFARVRNVVLSRLAATQLYLLRGRIEENRRTWPWPRRSGENCEKNRRRTPVVHRFRST